MPEGDRGEKPAWGHLHMFFYRHATPDEVHGRPALPPTARISYGPCSAHIKPSTQTCVPGRLLKHRTASERHPGARAEGGFGRKREKNSSHPLSLAHPQRAAFTHAPAEQKVAQVTTRTVRGEVRGFERLHVSSQKQKLPACSYVFVWEEEGRVTCSKEGPFSPPGRRGHFLAWQRAVRGRQCGINSPGVSLPGRAAGRDHSDGMAPSSQLAVPARPGGTRTAPGPSARPLLSCIKLLRAALPLPAPLPAPLRRSDRAHFPLHNCPYGSRQMLIQASVGE